MRELPLILCSLVCAAEPEARLFVRGSTPEIAGLSDWKLALLDGHPGVELFVVTQTGGLETFSFAKTGEPPTRAKPGRIEDPAHAALAFGSLENGSQTGLFIASPKGIGRIEPAADGSLDTPLLPLAPLAKMKVRTGRPTFAPLAVDVNGDGRTDVIVPNGNALEVWVQGIATGEKATRAFTKVATVQVRVSSTTATDGEALSDDLEHSLMIPSLRLQDVNGDGRADLLVEDGEKRAFHLVRADGSIPAVPDVSVDLSIFKDTTAKAELTLGRTLAGSERAVYESRDLDADSIPDAVIAQGRKVWVFHGTANGPQFTEPSTVLKAADDITAVMVLKLDDDERPDLLLAKVQVPTLGTILRGLVSTWDVEMNVAGYQNTGERKFDTTPKWKSTITFTVPSILSIAKDPEKLLTRFESVGRKFRSPAEADFDGDGAGDVALVAEDASTLDVWRGTGKTRGSNDASNEATLRRVLFEDENRAWDIDRVVAWLSSFGEQRVAMVTGGRAPDARIALRDGAQWRLATFGPGDVDGDGNAELVLAYEAVDQSGRAVFDVVDWK